MTSYALPNRAINIGGVLSHKFHSSQCFTLDNHMTAEKKTETDKKTDFFLTASTNLCRTFQVDTVLTSIRFLDI